MDDVTADIPFLDALRLIFENDDLYLCTDAEELDGRHPSICVYSHEVPGGFIGKLRWPRDGRPARVDPELQEILRAP